MSHRLGPALCLLLGWLIGASALAREPRYTVVRVDPRTQALALYLRDEHDRPLHSAARLQSWLAARGQRLRYAMNAGMYEPDYSPVGLFVADGRQLAPLNLRDGEGNFYLKPNGVFLLSDSGARVVESSRYPALSKGVRLATQSGPLLLQDGRIHPGFDPQSKSRHIRNGIAVKDGIVLLVISDTAVNLYEFAAYFRDTLHCADALYLDGTVSSLYAPELKRYDARSRLGPILGVIE
ncbi:phosphodiester glycosidase family protein [Lysobacter capsici]|uniref:phosphodiester glycosidase family protein n=1 Tax=Lysobacter capsici TaxID=435897 RepID=UPI001C008BA0|nr:phosphodiester glycosidase family protein [Lysobacter capsici]QWF15572.1 phosphodiester glycosidase family protein [Lysobacter capsici]